MFWSWRRNKLKLFCWTFIIAKFWIINFGWEKNVFQSASLSETERLLDKRNMRWLHLQLLQDKNLWGGGGTWLSGWSWAEPVKVQPQVMDTQRQTETQKEKKIILNEFTNVGFNILQTDTFHTVKIKQGWFKIWVGILGLKFDCGWWLECLQWIFTKHLKALNWFKL